METASYIALSRQGALRRQMDVTANNLANMNTTAYKAEQMLFVT
ncbi:MAG TPA: flagellar basal body protein, partial [Alphaproteobacteria bacterium]|nr:flagellar basal body protein [Alphaproteobacteria bacterium]